MNRRRCPGVRGATGRRHGKGAMQMTVREETQAIERQVLSPRACLSENSRGRKAPEAECPLRTCFQRDRDRVIHCKAFRRLKQKTQVLSLIHI